MTSDLDTWIVVFCVVSIPIRVVRRIIIICDLRGKKAVMYIDLNRAWNVV